ncbi:MAG TPA: alpha-ketoglutarate-dependent dioxygenase AlkB [Arenimonas sp.]|nr:alpha-ketoglutarate-dependent dioxygenase AlkB [Arenimonas sp.]
MGLVALSIPDADIRYQYDWLPAAEADALLDVLTRVIPWEMHRIRLFGREVASPRLSCWIGDADAVYTYSRTRFEPRPWLEALLPLRHRISAVAGETFNAVLANLYRDGRDSMGWHSDDEPELGRDPVIASVSLGAPRRFVFRHRHHHAQRVEIELAHGSLLLMRGATQRHWQHALPRSARVNAPRLNLTFRRIRD